MADKIWVQAEVSDLLCASETLKNKTIKQNIQRVDILITCTLRGYKISIRTSNL